MPTYTVPVTVNDNNGNPINGATVFVDGVTGGTTDSSGTTTITISTLVTTTASGEQQPSDSHQFTLSATSFQTEIQELTVNTETPIIANLTPSTPSGGSILTIICTPTTNGASASVTVTIGSWVSSGTTDATGSIFISSPIGTATIVVTQSGCVTNTSTVNVVSPATSTTIQMVLSNDPGSETAVASKPTANGSAQPIPAVSAAPSPMSYTDPNWVAADSSDGTYSTGNNARIYIGNLFIDEVSVVHFYMQDNKLPIYGYHSRFYDAIGQGRSLVQGGLSINFVHEGYLYVALQEYNNIVFATPTANSQQTAQLQAINQSIATLQTQAQAAASGSVIVQETINQQLQTLIQQQTSMLSNLPPSAVSQLQATASSQLVGHQDMFNAVYSDIMFDIVINITHGSRTITRKLEKCVLTGNSQTYDNGGNPITDDYSFIARKVR